MLILLMSSVVAVLLVWLIRWWKCAYVCIFGIHAAWILLSSGGGLDHTSMIAALILLPGAVVLFPRR